MSATTSGRIKTPKLIAALRDTMVRVEQTSGVEPDDPAMVELKDILSRRVAELESKSGENPGHETSPQNYVFCQEPGSSLSS